MTLIQGIYFQNRVFRQINIFKYDIGKSPDFLYCRTLPIVDNKIIISTSSCNTIKALTIKFAISYISAAS